MALLCELDMPELLDDVGNVVGSCPVAFESYFETSRRATTPAIFAIPALPGVEEGALDPKPVNPIESLQLFFARYGQTGINGVPLTDILPEDLEDKVGGSLSDTENYREFKLMVDNMIHHDIKAVERVAGVEQKRALNAPFIVGLNHALHEAPEETDVLVIGASYGNDFMRVQKGKRLGQKVVVDLVEPDTDAWESLKKRRELYHVEGDDFVCDFENYLLRTGMQRKYDIVLAHYSFQHIMRNQGCMSIAMTAFSKMLKPQGKVIACMMDPGGSMLLGEPDANSHSDTLRVLERARPKGECEWGTNTVQVGSRVWTDPVVNYSALLQAASYRNLVVEMMPGRETDRWPVIAKLKDAYRHPDMRAVMYFEIRHGEGSFTQPSAFSMLSEKAEGVACMWKKIQPREIMPVLNKGVPVTFQDSSFLRNGEYLLSDKTDGMSGYLVMHKDQHVARLMIGHTFWECEVPKPSGCELVCQVEVLADTTKLLGEYFTARVVGLDPIRVGLHAVSPFYGRLLQFLGAWRENFPWIGRKPWYKMTTENFNKLWEAASEGVVAQQMFAPPGMFRSVGTCRYVKKRVTFDAEVRSGTTSYMGKTQKFAVDDGIYEFEVREGRLVRLLRPRYDKLRPNGADDEERHKELMSLEGFRMCLMWNESRGVPFNFEEICPNLWKAIDGQVKYSDVVEELKSEIPKLGATYLGSLVFPAKYPMGKRIELITPTLKHMVYRVRYAAYVSLWTDRDIEKISSEISVSLSASSI